LVGPCTLVIICILRNTRTVRPSIDGTGCHWAPAGSPAAVAGWTRYVRLFHRTGSARAKLLHSGWGADERTCRQCLRR
jgi:hypothetical protein